MSLIDRRALLRAIHASAALGLLARGSEALADSPPLGQPATFSFEGLKAIAGQMMTMPYVAPVGPAADTLSKIDYDAWGKIRFNPDDALFADGPFPITFFHLGLMFQTPVEIYAVEGGQARQVTYDPADFDMPADSPARGLSNAGFAGFRVQERLGGPLDWRKNDWAAFLGASYFRAIGDLGQYGLSARAVAIDTVVSGKPEEFPNFTRIYIEKPAPDAQSVTIYALLDGPSVVGACRFVMTRDKGVTMDIDQTLFLRRAVSRLGVAPLTSMYWYSETTKPAAIDWRPEVHDSDGLAMWAGSGEHLWRPLNNPPEIKVSAFVDQDPKGFGLLQRDRAFDHYQDGVYYDRRPSLWVEPKAGWGRGTIQLIELPTNDEIFDNIVAAWVPEAPASAGSIYELGYRLYWQADEPHPTDLARCVATRLGRGGQPGAPRPQDVRKFVVEFMGGPLTALPAGVIPEMTLNASRGRFTDYRVMEAVSDGVAGHWRAEFDLAEVTGPEPVEMRLFLTANGQVASETWIFQYHPF